MEYLAKLFLKFSFSYKHRDETRSEFIERIIEEAKEHVSYYHADILEISGAMFKSDIKNFKTLLDTEPLSSEPTEEHHKYWVTFVIPTKKLLETSNSN